MFQINEIGAMIKSMLHIKQYLKTGISHFFIRCNLGGGGLRIQLIMDIAGFFVLSIEVLNSVC